MTKSKNDELKRLQEEAAKQTLAAEAIRQQKLAATTQYLIPSPQLESEKDEKGKTIDAYQEAVLKAYKDKYNIDPELDKHGNSVLHFSSPEEAHKFFKELADQKMPFLTFEIDASGGFTGNYKMSYGDGQLHEGRISPDKISALQQDFKNKMEPQPKPSQDFKSRMQSKKNGDEGSSPVLESKKRTAPLSTPLSTKPDPHK